MSRAIQLAKSIAGNWIAFAVSAGVAFFLSPFIVHHLGNIAYGVWTLVVSLISFMSLLDLGLRGAVTRFVARNHAQGHHSESSRAVSAAFWLRIWICLAILMTSVILSILSTRIFRIPLELHQVARWAIVFTGASLAVTLASGVFGGVLVALNRFALVSCVTVVQTAVRAVGVVYLLRSGHGILALAMLEFAVAALAGTSLTILCFKIYSELRLSMRKPDVTILKQFVDYSFYVFVIHGATQLIYYTDNLVVGAFISAGAVTFYAIGGSLLDYLRQVISSVTTIFMPLASGFEARGEQDQLRRLLIQGTRASLLIALPVGVALFFRGPTFIQLWMGSQYAFTSGRILRILLLAQVLSIANFTSGNIAFGLARHRPWALGVLAESVTNLGLSIFLATRIGLEGVAWGTVIPNVLVQLLFWPRFICKVLGISIGPYLWQSWARPALAVLPFAAACYFSDRYWTATHMLQFFLQIAALLPLFLVGTAICFWKEFGWRFRTSLISIQRGFQRKTG
jgi:O-antigen/teichoic acid export membrane protein